MKSFWNIVAIVLPIAAALIGVLCAMNVRYGTGDYGGRIGTAVLLVMGVAAASGVGAIAAVVALARGEARVWLSVLGLVANLAVVLPVAALFLRR